MGLGICEEGEKDVMVGGVFERYELMKMLLRGGMFIVIVYWVGGNDCELF